MTQYVVCTPRTSPPCLRMLAHSLAEATTLKRWLLRRLARRKRSRARVGSFQSCSDQHSVPTSRRFFSPPTSRLSFTSFHRHKASCFLTGSSNGRPRPPTAAPRPRLLTSRVRKFHSCLEPKPADQKNRGARPIYSVLSITLQ
jgi:hypothetical protein